MLATSNILTITMLLGFAWGAVLQPVPTWLKTLLRLPIIKKLHLSFTRILSLPTSKVGFGFLPLLPSRKEEWYSWMELTLVTGVGLV